MALAKIIGVSCAETNLVTWIKAVINSYFKPKYSLPHQYLFSSNQEEVKFSCYQRAKKSSLAGRHTIRSFNERYFCPAIRSDICLRMLMADRRRRN